MQSVVHNTSSETVKESGNSEVKKQFTDPSSPNTSTSKGQSLQTLQETFMTDLSESEDEEASEVDSFIIEPGDLDEEQVLDTSKFLLASEGAESPDLRSVDPETQARLEALLEAAGIGKLSTADGKQFADPEVLRKLTSSVSCALDEAAAALTRMRAENSEHLGQGDGGRSLAEACTDGDVGTVKKLLDEGRSVHETTEEGESLLSLACSAGYFELAQVLLAMRANVEDRGIKGDCTPLMEAASAGHADIVRLLIAHGADVNAQSSSGNTPLMYACAGGHEEVVKVLLEAGSNVEDHNENGHTPLMEAASAGHVSVARILLQHGAGINTHSNEFKESALTLACYKGHLEMVRFLLEAGADQEHKTDEMHTALMEASMDGHVDVARLLLDSGAQVNMPADSFESPLTLAACGGHVELAMLLLERGANIEEVNDEGYTPLMEAAREGHEEMVALLLSQGADINAQTEETQETALTLACCGGFLEVADFLIKAGADIELGASTPLMEAAQEGHLDLVRYLLDAGANVHAQTQTGDTALTYACENGHTDVADLLLQAGADLEHESEGGRTPLMKAARAGHLCTVQFLISRGADVNRQTTNNDHTPLSLACAGGHLAVVQLLLAHGGDPTHQLKDNSTMLIEAAKGGHIGVVQLLLDYPHNMMTSPPPPDLSQLTPPNAEGNEAPRVPPHGMRVILQESDELCGTNQGYVANVQPGKQAGQKTFLRNKNNNNNSTLRSTGEQLTTAELQQIKNSPQVPTSPSLPPDLNYEAVEDSLGNLDGSERDIKKSERFEECISSMMKKAELRYPNREEQIIQKQQILEELQRVERELQEKAKAQLLLNAAAAQHQQRLDQHQQQLGSSQSASALKSVHLSVTQSNQAHLDQGILEMSQSVDFSGSLNLELAGTVPDCSHLLPSDIVTEKESKSITKVLKKEGKTSKLQQSQAMSTSGLLDLDELAVMASSGVSDEPTTPQAPSQLVSPEALQTLSLKAIAQSEQAGIMMETLHAAQMTAAANAAKMSSDRIQGTPLPLVDSNIAQQLAPSPLSITMASTMTAAAQDSTNLVQANKNQLNAAVEVQGFVGNIPIDVAGSAAQMTSSQAAAFVTNQVVTQQYATSNTNTVATQYVDQTLTQQTTVAASNLPFLPGTVTTSTATATASAVSAATPASTQVPIQSIPTFPALNVNSQTDSNRDTALTLACAGGHDDLVQLLLSRGANLEHRDKKGFTPLILAATAGHVRVVEILLNHGADIEAQSERTKDTPLSLACSGGRYEVVELLLSRGANKEHRNVSDYTPLSLAASGGYVNIIKLLLNYGAEINSRTNSKLGISPLMLAAMNGHTAAVKLLLDNGGDINAQIETNRNTALTLACFQGRHEVVSLLVDRKANVEHRAKTGLTPLMEAASGGYVEVGRVLLDKGADVNAPPVPSSRDTALTIAADKGHYRFVELLLSRGAQVDVKNKKGNSPLWLAANGGHLDVVQLLVSAGADIDSQDNRKVSCLMAAFRKGHVKVVKWMVRHVSQFPSDQEMTRFIATITDKELLKKCHQCMESIRVAKDRQAVEANKYATILLEELDMEKTREESKKAAAARRRERKRKKKKEKQEKKMLQDENTKNDTKSIQSSGECSNQSGSVASSNDDDLPVNIEPPSATTTTTIGTVSTTTVKSKQSNIGGIGKHQSLPAAVDNHLIPHAFNSNGLSIKSRVSKEKVSERLNLNTSSQLSTSDAISNHSDSTGITPINHSKEREKISGDREKEKKKGADSSSINKSSNREPKGGNRDKEKSIEKNTEAGSGKNRASIAGGVVVSSSATTTTSTTTTATSWSSNKTTTVSSTTSSGSNKRKKGQYNTSTDGDESLSHGTGTSAKLQKSSSGGGSAGNASSKKGEVTVSTAIENFMGLTVDGYDLPSLNCLRSPTSLVNSLKSPPASMPSPKRGNKREEGWKEVVRKCNTLSCRSKKVIVPSNAISRVIGRGGCNINAIREVSGAHIEVEKQKGAGDRMVVIKGSADSTRQAHQLISALIKDPDRDLVELLPKNASTKSSATQNKGSSANQASSQSSSNQPKVPPLAFHLSTSSSSSTSSSAVSLASKPSGKSGAVALNSGMGVYSTPPFPMSQQGGVKQSLPNVSNSRPGIPVSPLSSAFANNSIPAWSVPTSAPASSSKQSNMSPKKMPVVRSTSTVATTPTNTQLCATVVGSPGGGGKSPAARQLFPSDKRLNAASSMTQSTTTSTKTTVSYTSASTFQAKNTFTGSANGASFASKVTKSKGNVVMSLQNPIATGSAKNNSVVGGIRSVQSTSNMSQTTTTTVFSSSVGSNACQSVLNGPMQLQMMGMQSRSQSSTPTSSTSVLNGTNGMSSTINTAPITTQAKLANAPQEYSPFNSFFSQVAQQSVWGKERDGDNRGMNFASVAASNMKHSGASSGLTGVAVPIPCSESQQVDAAKAPGYRGNSHISPGSSSNPVPICSTAHGSICNSAPSTPPLGPIAPPMSLSSANRRSPSPLLRSPPLGPGSLQRRSPAESPVLSSSAPVGNVVTMNQTSFSLSSLAPGGPPSMSSSGSGLPPHSSQMTLLTNQASNLARPLHLNPPPTSTYLAAGSPHAPSARFSVPTSGSTQTQSGMMGPNPPPPPPPQAIQSNLNPNAPDFSSRTSTASVVGGPQPQMSLFLNRMAPFGDASSVSAFRPMMSAGANSFTPPQGLSRHTFMMAAQQQQPPQQQPVPQQLSSQHQHQPEGGSQLPHSGFVTNMGGVGNNIPVDHVRLMGHAANVYNHRQQQLSIGTGPTGMPIGPQGLAASLNNQHQHFSSMSGQVLVGHRSASTTPSMGTSSKDEGSPITTVSPANSPHSSNPASPTAVGLNVGPSSDQQQQPPQQQPPQAHSVKAIGEDRKHLRPIGTERAHRKAPGFSATMSDSSMAGIWAFPSSDWMATLNADVPPEAAANEPSEDSVPLLTNNFATRFGEGLGPMENNNHPMDAQFQPSMMPPPVPNMGVNSPYPPFVNGMPPPLISQLYGGTGNGTNGLMNDVWPSTINKMGAGDSAMPGPVGNQGSAPAPHLIQEPKIMWNWNQLQM